MFTRRIGGSECDGAAVVAGLKEWVFGLVGEAIPLLGNLGEFWKLGHPTTFG